MAATTYIVDKDGNQIDASTATVPQLVTFVERGHCPAA